MTGGAVLDAQQADQRVDAVAEVEGLCLDEVSAGDGAVDQPLCRLSTGSRLGDSLRREPVPSPPRRRAGARRGPAGSCTTCGTPCRRSSTSRCSSARSETCRSMIRVGRAMSPASGVRFKNACRPSGQVDSGSSQTWCTSKSRSGRVEQSAVRRGGLARCGQHLDVEVGVVVVLAGDRRPADEDDLDVGVAPALLPQPRQPVVVPAQVGHAGTLERNWRAVASTVRLRWVHAASPEHPASSTAALTFPRRAAAPPCEGLFHVLNELSDQTRRKSEDDEPGAGHERRRESG